VADLRRILCQMGRQLADEDFSTAIVAAVEFAKMILAVL
jgi:hypothetical protein